MLIIINAFKSIWRSKGRNILIGIIVLVIATSSCVALAIKNAANEAEAAGLDSASITGSISVNREELMKSAQDSSSSGSNMEDMRELMSKYQDLSLDELQTYADSEYASNFYYTASISLDASGDLEAYSTQSSSDSSSDSSENNRGQPGFNMAMSGGMTMGDFTANGYSSEDAMTEFINGTSKITDGNIFDIDSSDLNCLISNELAVFNGLSVGDKITLANPNSEDETYSFTICGIYTNSSSGETETGMRFSTSQDPANQICISYNALNTVCKKSKSVATTSTDDNGTQSSTAINNQISGTYVFSNKENYDAFSTELTEKGLSEYYTLSSSDIDSYEASLVPLQSLSNFASTLLLIVLGIGAVILVVINIFNIRERKYEVGVLTAIGIKKGKVAMQFVTELLCVTLIAIVIGTGIGAAVSVPISNSLLAAQIEQQETQSQSQNENFGRMGNAPNTAIGGAGGSAPTEIKGGQIAVEYLTEINATIDFTILCQLIGIGILLTIISSLGAVIFVLRYEPLKILANRS